MGQPGRRWLATTGLPRVAGPSVPGSQGRGPFRPPLADVSASVPRGTPVAHKPHAADSCLVGPRGSRRYLAVAEGFVVGYDICGADGQMTVSFVAVPGTTGRTTPVPPNATGTRRTTGTTTQGSALPALRAGRMRSEHARAGRFTDRTGVQRCSPWPSLQCRWLMLSHRPNDKAARRV